MEVVHIKKKINYFIFFLVPHDKFLSPPLLTPLKKNSGVASHACIDIILGTSSLLSEIIEKDFVIIC